ncbi:unnamed protein product, partial [Brassica oleracea]
ETIYTPAKTRRRVWYGNNSRYSLRMQKSKAFTRIRSLISKSLEEEEKPNLYETEDDKNKVVLYFTSLRGIRKTYEDCCCVRTVVRGYQVAVLIRGVHVGGMEEIKKLNDGGKLGEMLKGLPACESVGACGCCGDPSVLWSTLLALFFPSSRQLCFFILSSSNLPPKHCF